MTTAIPASVGWPTCQQGACTFGSCLISSYRRREATPSKGQWYKWMSASLLLAGLLLKTKALCWAMKVSKRQSGSQLMGSCKALSDYLTCHIFLGMLTCGASVQPFLVQYLNLQLMHMNLELLVELGYMLWPFYWICWVSELVGRTSYAIQKAPSSLHTAKAT